MSTSTAAPRSTTDADSTTATQQTLAGQVQVTGVGLHLGQQTTVNLMPAKSGEGRYFVRTDLAKSGQSEVKIPADASAVVQTRLSTELGVLQPSQSQSPQANPSSQSDFSHTASHTTSHTVRTVEHLLAALVALETDNVRIEIDGPELPLLDGSAKGWMDAIASTGITSQSAQKLTRLPLSSPLTVHEDDAWVAAFPSTHLRFSYGIDFDLAAIGNQWHSWTPTNGQFADSFAEAIAPARTFGLAHQIDYLRAQGLIKGGSLENALVCGPDGWLNPPLRFDNEPARHKMLDLIGDLGLLGSLPQAHYVAYKASHALHVALAKQLAKICPVL